MTPPTYGPHNPHPLSQMRTELVWEGKYDEYGQRLRNRLIWGDNKLVMAFANAVV